MASSWFSNISLQATMQQLAGELAEEFSDFGDLQSQLTKSMGEASNLINNVNNLDILNLDEMAVQEEVEAARLEDGDCDGEDIEAEEEDDDDGAVDGVPDSSNSGRVSKPSAPVPMTFLPFDDPFFDIPEIVEENTVVETSSPLATAAAATAEQTLSSESAAVDAIDNLPYRQTDSEKEEVTSLDLEYEQYESQLARTATEEEKVSLPPEVEDVGPLNEHQSADVTNTSTLLDLSSVSEEFDSNVCMGARINIGDDVGTQPTVAPPIAVKAATTATSILPALPTIVTQSPNPSKENLESTIAPVTPVEKSVTVNSSKKPATTTTTTTITSAVSESVPTSTAKIANPSGTNKSTRSKALKPLKPQAKTTKNLDFWGIDSRSKGNKSAAKPSNDKSSSSSSSSGATLPSSGMANVSLLFDPMGLGNGEEFEEASIATAQDSAAEGNPNLNQTASSPAKEAEVSKASSVSSSSLSAIVGQFLAPQRIVVGLSITQTFSYFDNVDEEIDLEADPILNQVKKNKSQPSAESASSSAASYALNMLKSYAFSNSAALSRDPYSSYYKESSLTEDSSKHGQPKQFTGSSSSGSQSHSIPSSNATSTSTTGPGGDTTVYWFRNRPVLNWCRRKLNMLCNRARDVFIVLYLRLSAGVMYVVERLSQGVYYCFGRIANPIQSARDVYTYCVEELSTSEGQSQSGGTLRWLVRSTTNGGLLLLENMTLTNFVLIVLAMVFFYVFWKFGRYSIDPTGSTVLAKSVTKHAIT